MFNLGWPELFVIGVITLIVVGPKELPKVLRTVSAIMGQMRKMTREFQRGVDDFVRDSEIDEMRKEVRSIADGADIQKQMDRMLEEDGDLPDWMNDPLGTEEKPKATGSSTTASKSAEMPAKAAPADDDAATNSNSGSGTTQPQPAA